MVDKIEPNENAFDDPPAIKHGVWINTERDLMRTRRESEGEEEDESSRGKGRTPSSGSND